MQKTLRAKNMTSLKKHKSTNTQSGYLLIELAIVMIVIALSVAVMIPIYENFRIKNAKVETEKRMDVVARSISNFIQMHHYLPCPANPTGTAGTAFGTAQGSCVMAVNVSSYGILPYRTLGIPEQYAKDGWGNFFTYAVSPDFTNQTDTLVTATSVNQRLANKVATDMANGVDNLSLLPLANFCLPLQNTRNDLLIHDELDNQIYPNTAVRTVNSVPRPDVYVPDGNLNKTDPVNAVALALISHGENGYGAYAPNGTPGGSAAASDIEIETNGRDDNIIRIQTDVSDTGYDDIIKYYTQDQILAAAGGGSCEDL